MKVALYCRLSDEDRNKLDPTADSESIQNQKTMLINYAVQQGWDIFNIYADDDYSGSDRTRPQFLKMLEAAEAGQFDILLCKSQSRFSRELEIVEKYIHGLFLEWNIRFVSIVDNADTANEGNKKSRQINGLVNEWYLEDVSNNVRAVLTSKRKQGQHIGSFALYGYQKDPDCKNHLIIDEEAAQVVRMVYSLYLQGNGSTRIANILNQQKIPNPSAYKRLKGENFHPAKRAPKGDLWSYTTVTAMLHNQMYTGDMVQGKTKKISYKSKASRRTAPEDWFIVENTHDPIISREDWNAVQKRLDSCTKPTKSGTVHIFAGKAKCAQCGKILHSQHAKGIKYLRCPTSDTSKELCSGCSIQLRQLESYVLTELNTLCDQYFDEAQLLDEVHLSDNLSQQENLLNRQLLQAEKTMAQAVTALKALYMDKLHGDITQEMFLELSQAITQDKEQAAAHKDQLSAQLSEIAALKEKRESKEEIIRKYRHFDELNRPLVEEFIKEIHIGKRDIYGALPEIEIDWNL
ncbi:MAG: recombinase family protein [Angelakisella sp.]|nr:recombinase family protein [Angelakisella sp.]